MKVDTSAVRSLTAEAEAILTTSGERMKAILDAAASSEREEHAYTNRSYNLEQSTFASELEESGDSVSVTVGERAHYASYVEHLGYSDMEQKIADADVAIATMLEADAERLASR